jgi:hypothetical protein
MYKRLYSMAAAAVLIVSGATPARSQVKRGGDSQVNVFTIATSTAVFSARKGVGRS